MDFVLIVDVLKVFSLDELVAVKFLEGGVDVRFDVIVFESDILDGFPFELIGDGILNLQGFL